MARSTAARSRSGGEQVGVRGVPAEQHRPALFPQEIAAPAPVPVGHHPRPPVSRLDRLHLEAGDQGGLPPGELVDVVEPAHQIAIPGLHDDARLRRNGPERAEVGVVHVRMGEQDRVEPRQLTLSERGLDEASRPHLGEAPAEADAALERGIGEDRGAVQIQQHGGVSEPRNGQPVVGPGGRIRPMWRRGDAGDRLAATLAHRGAGVPSGKGQSFVERQALVPQAEIKSMFRQAAAGALVPPGTEQ